MNKFRIYLNYNFYTTFDPDRLYSTGIFYILLIQKIIDFYY